MPPPKPALPAAAQPKFRANSDVWNSSSTGHQRAEKSQGGSTEWRHLRTVKLSHQFHNDGAGRKRISDQVSAGSKDWDERAKGLVPKNARQRAKSSAGNMSIVAGCTGTFGEQVKLKLKMRPIANILTANTSAEEKSTVGKEEDHLKEERRSRQKGIFDGLVVFINGSTYPLISDHKLKALLVENGAKLSLHLGRRQVTHVILGRPCGAQGMGAGGGLAGTKIEKEIKRIRGCGVTYVGVEWVLESMKAGKRLSETPFANLKVAAKGQHSVYTVFKNSTNTGPSTGTVQDVKASPTEQ